MNYVISSSLMCMLFMGITFLVYVVLYIIRYKTSAHLLAATMGLICHQILVITVFYMLCLNNDANAVLGSVLFVAFSILSDMAVLNSFENMLEKIHIEREWKSLSAQRQQEYEHYQKVQESIEQMRMERHDYVNYMQAVERLLGNEKDYKEACGLLQEIRIRDRSYNDEVDERK